MPSFSSTAHGPKGGTRPRRHTVLGAAAALTAGLALAWYLMGTTANLGGDQAQDAGPCRIEQGAPALQAEVPETVAARALGQLRDRFPSLGSQLAMQADFPASHQLLAGREVTGWTPDAALAAPAGLKAQEREAWLAMAHRAGSGTDFSIFFPHRFSDPGLVSGAGLALVQQPLGGSTSTGVVTEGKLVYADAYPATDAIQAVHPGGSEEYLLLRDATAPTRFATAVCSAAGAPALTAIRPCASGLEIVDAAGHHAQVGAPYVVDATGARSSTAARWEVAEAGRGKFTITLALAPAGLSYPLVIDPSWTTYGNQGSLAYARTSHTATLLNDGTVLVAGGWEGNAIAVCELYRDGTWTITAPLHGPRMDHTATLLGDGTVLVAGGMADTTVPLGSCEIFNGSSWTVTGSMIDARKNHTATLLTDGSVLVAGGSDLSGAVANCEIFRGGSWTATGSLASARLGHTATLLSDGTVLVAGGDQGGVPPGSCEIYNAGVWTLTGTLGINRSNHTATLLGDGTVLVAGGNDNFGNVLAECELYSAGAWSPTGPLNDARVGHAATLLPNGTVLVEGGNNSNTPYSPLASSEIWSGGAWAPTGALNSGRTWHTATLLPDGQVLVAGGDGNFTPISACEIRTGTTWTQTGSAGNARQNHTATLLGDGTVLVAGGIDSAGFNLASCLIYSGGSWTTTGSLATARANHTATLLSDGSVLVAGGSDQGDVALASCEIYSAGSWTTTGSLALPRVHHTATLLNNGTVLVAGGEVTASCEIYSAGVWSATGTMGNARYFHTATLLANGSVLVAGGLFNGQAFASCELYSGGGWSATGDLVQAHEEHTATLLANGDVLVTGGVSYDPIAFCEIYHVSGGSWSATGALSVARADHTASLLHDGTVLVAGGRGANPANTSTLTSCEIFNGGSWTATSPLGNARANHTATVLANGDVLAAFGMNDVGPVSSHELYFPGAAMTVIPPADVIDYAHDDAGTVVTYPGATVIDPDGAQPTITYSQDSGTTFPHGATIVSIQASDVLGATANASFTVRVVGPAEITVADIFLATYDGRPHGVVSTVAPAGLTVTTTYNGVAGPPINAGMYNVALTVVDPDYYGTATTQLYISPANQVISFPQLSPLVVGASATPLIATASSGLPVSFHVVSGPATIGAGGLIATATGMAVLAADQAGNGNWAPANTVTQTVACTQLATVSLPATTTVTYDGSPHGITAITSPAGLATTTTYNGSTTVPISGGTYAVVATVTAPGYSGQGSATLVITPAAQTITFPAIGTLPFNAGPLALSASASSGLPVTFQVLSGPATISGGILNPTAPGVVVVAADQAGDGDFLPAIETTQQINVPAAATVNLAGMTVLTYTGNSQGVSVTTNPPGLALLVLYDGVDLAPTAAGTYSVLATVVDPSFNGQSSGVLTILPADQSIAFAPIGTLTLGGAPGILSASASSGLPVTFQVLSGPATISGGALVANAAGTVVVAADQTGDANHLAAAEVTQQVTVQPAAGSAGSDDPSLFRRCGHGSGLSTLLMAALALLLRVAVTGRRQRQRPDAGNQRPMRAS